MRFFTFAAILGAAAAQDEELPDGFEFVNVTPIADASNGQVLSTGEIGEWAFTSPDDGSKTAGMYITHSTTCNGCMFANGAVVQTWIEAPSKFAPGKVEGMICTANWEKSTQYSVNHQVTNYMEAEPLSDNTKAWNYNFGYVTDEDLMFWGEETENVEDSYQSAYTKNTYSRQDCSAVGILYAESADGIYIEELGGSSAEYWEFKNNHMPWTFTSGYRIYESASSPAPYQSGTAGETTYTLADHGFTDTTPPPAEDETTDDTATDGSGAAALMATATALAAFLVF